MAKKYCETDVRDAFEYGIGLLCAKHNITLSKANRNSHFKDLKRWLNDKKLKRKQ